MSIWTLENLLTHPWQIFGESVMYHLTRYFLIFFCLVLQPRPLQSKDSLKVYRAYIFRVSKTILRVYTRKVILDKIHQIVKGKLLLFRIISKKIARSSVIYLITLFSFLMDFHSFKNNC